MPFGVALAVIEAADAAAAAELEQVTARARAEAVGAASCPDANPKSPGRRWPAPRRRDRHTGQGDHQGIRPTHR